VVVERIIKTHPPDWLHALAKLYSLAEIYDLDVHPISDEIHIFSEPIYVKWSVRAVLGAKRTTKTSTRDDQRRVEIMITFLYLTPFFVVEPFATAAEPPASPTDFGTGS